MVLRAPCCLRGCPVVRWPGFRPRYRPLGALLRSNLPNPSPQRASPAVGELAANGAGAAALLETQGSASSLKGQLSAGSDPAGADTPSKKKGKKGRKSLDKTADDAPAAGGGASALESAASADRGALAEGDAASDGGAKSHTGAKGGGGADAAEEQQQKQQQGAAAAGSRSATDMANPLGASKGSLLAATAQVNPDAELVRASDPLDEVRAAPVRVTDLSKQLKEQFASASTGGSGEGARDGTAGGAPRRDSSGNMASLTQHDLVNTANVALVRAARLGPRGGCCVP